MAHSMLIRVQPLVVFILFYVILVAFLPLQVVLGSANHDVDFSGGYFSQWRAHPDRGQLKSLACDYARIAFRKRLSTYDPKYCDPAGKDPEKHGNSHTIHVNIQQSRERDAYHCVVKMDVVKTKNTYDIQGKSVHCDD